MSQTITLNASLALTRGSLALGNGSAIRSVVQADPDGKFSTATLKCSTSTTAVIIPKGNCVFGGEECRVQIDNLSETDGEDIILMSAATSGTEISRVKPGECSILTRRADLYAYSAAGTPTLKAFYSQV